MSDLDSFPLGRLGLVFLVEPEKGSTPESTVFTGGRPMGTALLSSLVRLRAAVRQRLSHMPRDCDQCTH